ncbi:head decoration protein [Pseudomonas aeruginosa]|uniref:head decoration protein n=1 Tax=Pseudomonas aeruginosa TaxID=287 RepID=UPI00383B3449
MAVKIEGIHAGEFLLSEGNGGISRETLRIPAGEALPAGQLLKEADGLFVPYPPPVEEPKAATKSAKPAAGSFALLVAPLRASGEERSGVAVVRLAEVAGGLLSVPDDAAAALAVQMVIIR